MKEHEDDVRCIWYLGAYYIWSMYIYIMGICLVMPNPLKNPCLLRFGLRPWFVLVVVIAVVVV